MKYTYWARWGNTNCRILVPLTDLWRLCLVAREKTGHGDAPRYSWRVLDKDSKGVCSLVCANVFPSLFDLPILLWKVIFLAFFSRIFFLEFFFPKSFGFFSKMIFIFKNSRPYLWNIDVNYTLTSELMFIWMCVRWVGWWSPILFVTTMPVGEFLFLYLTTTYSFSLACLSIFSTFLANLVWFDAALEHFSVSKKEWLPHPHMNESSKNNRQIDVRWLLQTPKKRGILFAEIIKRFPGLLLSLTYRTASPPICKSNLGWYGVICETQ